MDSKETITVPAYNLNQEIMIDLHGRSVEEARHTINWYVEKAEEANTRFFRFVTGRGNHINSRGERGTLFNAFNELLSKDNLNKIQSIKRGNGYYDVKINNVLKDPSPTDNLDQYVKQWFIDHRDGIARQAKNGDPECQYILGHCAHYGIGCEQNYSKAVNYYTKSAKSNHPLAQYALAACYWQGLGVRQDDKKAIELFEASAKQGYPFSIHTLGDIYFYGKGVQCDRKRGVQYYQEASQLGMDLAKRKLAHIYQDGIDIKKDEIKAFQLYKEVADNGDPFSAYNVAYCYINGSGVEKNERQAFIYAKQSADGDDPDGEYLVATFYHHGIGTEKNQSLSFEYMERSANHNFKHALFQLAMHPAIRLKDKEKSTQYLIRAAKAGQIIAQAMLLEGFFHNLTNQERDFILKRFWEQEDRELLSIEIKEFKLMVLDTYLKQENFTKKQKQKILRILKALADQNLPEAYARLGGIYMEGTVVEKDLRITEKYWQEGAKLGCRNSLCSLGYFYEKSMNGTTDYEKAFYYHSKAAEKRSANSHNQLGSLYKDGKSVKQSFKKASEHYQEAIKLDSGKRKHDQHDGLFYLPVFPHAAYNLARLYVEGSEDFPSDDKQAFTWLTKAAEAGQEDAKKQLLQFKEWVFAQNYQQTDKANFWKNEPPSTVKTHQTVEETKNPLAMLQKFSDHLALQVEWKMTKEGNAWGYIKIDQLKVFEQFLLKPIVSRKTKAGEYILLLEKAQEQNQNIALLIEKIQKQNREKTHKM